MYKQHYRKESSENGAVDNTYKSCSGTILGFNDYGWKSSILVQYIKIISKHSRWPENRRSIAEIRTFHPSVLLSPVNNSGPCPYFM